MKVIKRDGRVQEFDINKIKITIQAASDEAGEPFTYSDINNLSKAIEEEVRKDGREEIQVKEILDIVLLKLAEFGFNGVVRYYREYKKNLYRDK